MVLTVNLFFCYLLFIIATRTHIIPLYSFLHVIVNPYAYFIGAPWDLKAAYAFRLYDFNGDAHLCKSDLEETLIYITGTVLYASLMICQYCMYMLIDMMYVDDGLEAEELQTIVDLVFKEVDIDQDEKISYAEFEHIISRAPDFINLFRISF